MTFVVPPARPVASKQAIQQERVAILSRTSVVVPVGPREFAWMYLLPDLLPLPADAQVSIVGAESEPSNFRELLTLPGLRCSVRWIQSPFGRAKQLNHGATSADSAYLWFMHADSRVDPGAFEKLAMALSLAPDALHYFDLAFDDAGPPLTWINAWGANMRSHCFGLPFGDQGLCLSRAQFERLGGFDEQATYGEDHLFVWKAHRLGIQIRPVGAHMQTSARKYKQRGWLRTTLLHLYRTVMQAVPGFVGLVLARVQGRQ